ncbi:hypothetical protein ACWDTP_16895 [Mycobacterium sp. NPDC003449]
MTTDPDQLRAQVAEVLSGLPDISAGGLGPDTRLDVADIDLLAARLEQAHEILVNALESVDRGQQGGPAPGAGG